MKRNRNWEHLAIEKRKPLPTDVRNLNMDVFPVEMYTNRFMYSTS